MKKTEENIKYEIEKGIQLPPRRMYYKKYPLDEMIVGDSFKVMIITKDKPLHRTSEVTQLSAAIQYARKGNKNKKFATRIYKEECYIRCWRLE